ncbi:MAG: thioredoxin domain-containing protein [Acidimicrobiia bacterium]|nr:thioredoxin domain-containing protein [Acidimicrobiia bacterium]
MPNRLADATSPYLLQHADNPVDWFEWGEEAFAAARDRNVPIFLSVGYSACHWCHVMAHESFEDDDTAALMNDWFVNVKVDREERPDVDSVYMDAVQAMTRRGGWPMSVWLTPDGRPFFAGTYYPSAPRHGMPSFTEVCRSVHDAWTDRRTELLDQSERLTLAIGRRLPEGKEAVSEEDLRAAFEALRRSFDHTHGGFGGAPKFPQTPVLQFLLDASLRPWGEGARDMLDRTLDQMAAGGLRDHVGGGFARYAVDGHWEIPHFEKMLYDNAQLASVYLRSWHAGGPEHHRDIAIETIEYVLRDLALPDGGIASAEDADSEGEEGLFYTWPHEEFVEVAGDLAPLALELWGVTERGNFEGRNHLRSVRRADEVAERHGTTPEAVVAAAREVLDRLFERRAGRVRPGLDDKVVAAWNGLLLAPLAEGGVLLDKPEWVEAARGIARFVRDTMRRPDGLLHRTWAKGTVGPVGVLEDHAGFAVGLCALHQATGEAEWLTWARELVALIPEHFEEGGRLHATAGLVDDLPVRPQDLSDNPQPSGSSLAVHAFLTVGHLTNDPDLLARAEQAASGSMELVRRAALGVGSLLATRTAFLDPRELAIVGPDPGPLLEVLRSTYRPGTVLGFAAAPHPEIPLTDARGGEGTLAYVCRGFVCDAPVGDPEALRTALASG